MISLQQLRNPYFMKWGLWAILIVTIPAFVALYGFAPPAQQSGMPTGALVTVQTGSGRVQLDAMDLEQAKREATNYYTRLASMALGIPAQSQGQIQQMIFTGLGTREVTDFAIAQVAMRERMEAQGLRVSDNQVSTQLRSEGITRERLAQILRNNRMTETEYASLVRRQIADRLAESTINRAARTSLLELWQEFLLANEEITGEMVRIPVTVDQDMIVPDDRLAGHYEKLVEERDNRVIDRERRVYRYVALSAPPMSPPQPTEEELRAAYEAADENDPDLVESGGYSVRQILFLDGNAGERRARAEEALARVETGEEFAAVANEFSDDPDNILSFAMGEDDEAPRLGGLVPNPIDPESETARRQYGQAYTGFLQEAEAGQTSGILETPRGLAIVKVEEKSEGGRLSFQEARSILRQRLMQSAEEEHEHYRQARITENFEALRDASVRETTLDGIARTIDMEVQVTSPTLATATFIPGIGNLQRETQILRGLRTGGITPVLQAQDGTIAIVSVAEVIPESIRPLEDIRSQMERAVRREVATEEAHLLAGTLRERTEAGDTLTSAALTLDLDAQTVGPFTRDTPPSELAGTLEGEIKLLRAKLNDFIVLESGSPQTISEVIALKVTEVNEPSRQRFLDELETLERNFLMAKRQGFVEDFRRDAVANLRASYHRDFRPDDR